MPEDNERTTIVLKRATRNKLAALGGKDDSFDEILNRLADFWIQGKKLKEK